MQFIFPLALSRRPITGQSGRTVIPSWPMRKSHDSRNPGGAAGSAAGWHSCRRAPFRLSRPWQRCPEPRPRGCSSSPAERPSLPAPPLAAMSPLSCRQPPPTARRAWRPRSRPASGSGSPTWARRRRRCAGECGLAGGSAGGNIALTAALPRRKLKNRVAAQSARDRKKARMTELEQQVVELEEEVRAGGCGLEVRGGAAGSVLTALCRTRSCCWRTSSCGRGRVTSLWRTRSSAAASA